MSQATRNLLRKLAVFVVLWMAIRLAWNAYAADDIGFLPTTAPEFLVIGIALAGALFRWFNDRRKVEIHV